MRKKLRQPRTAGKDEAGGGESGARGNSSRGNPIAVSTYSFWRFKDDSKLSIERCIDEAAHIGFDAVELLHMQMEGEYNA